jgi:hypothetical protein
MNEGQCWDAASKQVKSKPAATAGGTASKSAPGATGTTGAAPPSGTAKPGTAAGTRPAGMQNC